jgi:putative ABC transport system permease protein
MAMLDRKLRRDLIRIWGQVIAIGFVIAAGVAVVVLSMGTLTSLRDTRDAYYERYRFAHVFAFAKRAPERLAAVMEDIPGVARVDTRIVQDIILEMPDLLEPARGRIISIPEEGEPDLNQLFLRSGRPVERGHPDEVVLNVAFAEAHGLNPGDDIVANVNGRRRTLHVVGTALSPEYVYAIAPGAFFPDNRRFGVMWMGREALEAAFDLDGAFNNVTLSLTRTAVEADVIDRVDDLIEPYGGIGAYGRDDQQSNAYVKSEFEQLATLTTIVPPIFLAVAAFLLNIVISRLIDTEREQVGLLKAFGYSDLGVGWHYMKFVLAIASIGVLMGWGLGAWLGRGMTEMYTEYFQFPFLYYHPDLSTFIGSGVLSLAVAVAGAWFAVRRAVRIPPAVAMQPPAPPAYHEGIGNKLINLHWFGAPTRMIVRHIVRWPVRAGLTVVGISLSGALLVASFFFLDAIDEMLDLFFFANQRQDVTVVFSNPRADFVANDLYHLPGVERVEVFRSVPVKLRHGHLEERVGITGIDRGADLSRLTSANGTAVELPPDGIVLTEQLATELEAGVGDWIEIEVMEGRRPHIRAPVNAISQEYVGLSAYMDRLALARMMEEAPAASGGYLSVEASQLPGFFEAVKEIPAIQEVSLRGASLEEFERIMDETMVTMISFYVVFGALIAIGVVYNSARISLSERARELASMRVLGFTKGEVAGVLLGELAVVTFIALPLGCFFGFLLASFMVQQFSNELYRLPLIIYPTTYGRSVLVVTLSAVITGFLVARRVNNLDLVAVLKTRE